MSGDKIKKSWSLDAVTTSVAESVTSSYQYAGFAFNVCVLYISVRVLEKVKNLGETAKFYEKGANEAYKKTWVDEENRQAKINESAPRGDTSWYSFLLFWQ